MVIYFSRHLTVLFAVEELSRLYRESHEQFLEIYYSSDGKIPAASYRLILMLESEWKQKGLEDLALKDDGFALVVENSDLFIVGATERSLLYGVYYYAEAYLGFSFVGLNETLQDSSTLGENTFETHNPLIQRRGNVIETIRDTQYVKQLIDWGAKNGLNEFFFTFFLWDEIGPVIVEELEKRSYDVTLGGHSLSFLLGDEVHKVIEGTVFFEGVNDWLHDVVICRIVEICQAYPIVSRISLWPEDVGIHEKNYATFMPSYISFVEKLMYRLTQANLLVDVEHIVYNAGLEWNMLERNKHIFPSSDVDVLYAYWGRNYANSLLNQEKNQLRAYQALLDWNGKVMDSQRELTVLEYYSDHFMLSELFPPLFKRIEADMKDYSRIGVKGVINLIVPVHQKQAVLNRTNGYPWKWVQMMNNYFYAGLSWGKEFDTLCDRFFAMFGMKESFYRKLLDELEAILAKHTKWNIPLFPARIVDPEKVFDKQFANEVMHYLDGVYEFLEKQLVQFQGQSSLSSEDNFLDLPPEEMLIIYLHYVRKSVETLRNQWREKYE